MERIRRIVQHEKYQLYLERIRVLEQGRPFCLHPIEHFIDVARISYILWLETIISEHFGIQECTGNQKRLQMNEAKLLIYAASLLHDIGRYQQYLYGYNHADIGADLAVEILSDTDFDTEQQDLILDAIRNHNRSHSDNWLTSLLQTGDRLSRACYRCSQRASCYKLDQMETSKGIIY